MNKILCVNDNDINLLILKRQVELSGIAKQVICLTDGQEALDYYADLKDRNSKDSPDLIFLDIHMPNVNGWEFLEEFTETYLPSFPDTKVIVFSYSLDDSERIKTEKFSYVVDFMNIPLTVNYLHDLQSEILGVK